MLSNYDQYTVAQLKDIARKRNLHKYSKLKKNDLIHLLCGKRTLYLDIIYSHWFIITKKVCDYCKKAKMLLNKQNQDYNVFEITEKNKQNIYSVIDKKTNEYRYFPIVFKNGKFIGGYTELEKMF